MSDKTHGTTLAELCADHGEEGEVLRQQLDAEEQVDMYVVGKNSEILALTLRSLYIVKPGLLHMFGASAVRYPYEQVKNVAVHASQRKFAFEVQASGTSEQVDPVTAADIEYNLPNVVPLEERDLPAFEGALALVIERIANARP